MRAPTGILLLVPNTLDFGAQAHDMQDLQDQLPLGVIRRAAGLVHWVVEDARSARVFLKRVAAVVPLAVPLQSIDIRELPRARKGSGDTVPAGEWLALLGPALAGHDLGLLSEAGLPAVADPGAALVQAAHEAGVPVTPLPGASSLLLALAASGLNGQSFAFVGYLPQEPAARTLRAREIESLSRRQRQTQIVIETPYRNQALLDALLADLSPSTRLSVSVGLTLSAPWTRCDRVSAWRSSPAILPDRLPAVFALLA
jgi:16S rRNA (cytidine1402-2'-O)-methyltransferase